MCYLVKIFLFAFEIYQAKGWLFECWLVLWVTDRPLSNVDKIIYSAGGWFWKTISCIILQLLNIFNTK